MIQHFVFGTSTQCSRDATGCFSDRGSHCFFFIAGYGSLICPHSRSITVPEQAHKVATPVLVKGVERTWAKRTTRGMTAMGVRFVEDGECVGVLLPVDDSELARFDEREQGYDRVRLDLDMVDAVPFLDDDHYEDDRHSVFLSAKSSNEENKVAIWVYVPQTPLPAAEEAPIVQSYVDTILRGCLHISEEFAKEFVATTKGWSKEELLNETDSESDSSVSGDEDEEIHWIDDRHDPIYIRGDREWSMKNVRKLDRLLKEHRPHHFKRRKSLKDLRKNLPRE